MQTKVFNTYRITHENGESVSTNELLQTEVAPLSEGESARVYKAVFRAE